MKKQGTTDAKKAAANDKENGNGKTPAKAPKPARTRSTRSAQLKRSSVGS
jgi:hypothetical protein